MNCASISREKERVGNVRERGNSSVLLNEFSKIEAGVHLESA